MNELMYNFINQIEDVNKVKELTVEEFSKLVKANKLISEDDARQLIDSFKKISNKKNEEDESTDTDQRKKKYREQHKEVSSSIIDNNEKENNVRENDYNDIER